MSIQDTLAANMRRFRKTSKLSQEKLAEIAGLHRTYIGGIEQRRINVSLKNIGKIADALGVKPMLLFADLEATGVRSGETANGEEAADSIADTMEASESIADDAMTDNSIAGGAMAGGTGTNASVALVEGRKGPAHVSLAAAQSAIKNAPRARVAVAVWDDDDNISFRPIEEGSEDLTMRVLTNLVRQGYSGTELAREYDAVVDEVVRFLSDR